MNLSYKINETITEFDSKKKKRTIHLRKESPTRFTPQCDLFEIMAKKSKDVQISTEKKTNSNDKLINFLLRLRSRR